VKKVNILAIGAHPDDIEFGCGGTLAKYVGRSHRLFLLIMTLGEQGGSAALRKAEQESSACVLGAEHIFWGGYEDTHIIVNQQIIQNLENVIHQVQPDFIFCHYPDDSHQDHRHLAQAVISATRNMRNVLFYEGPTTKGFTPCVYVYISTSIDTKIEALKAHHSQIMKTNVKGLSIIEIAHASANFRGIQVGVKHAEGFFPLKLFINI
jgi:LmbE family N-acetylglucosaminyl deacetylase